MNETQSAKFSHGLCVGHRRPPRRTPDPERDDPGQWTIVATQPCTLPSLGIVDFRQLLGRQRDLVRIIYEEAERRLEAAPA
jgi:CRP-like cAMP-binding protein